MFVLLRASRFGKAAECMNFTSLLWFLTVPVSGWNAFVGGFRSFLILLWSNLGVQVKIFIGWNFKMIIRADASFLSLCAYSDALSACLCLVLIMWRVGLFTTSMFILRLNRFGWKFTLKKWISIVLERKIWCNNYYKQIMFF